MKNQETNLDRLLKARAEIDDELRRHKSSVTVLFTDIVGSTAYFDRFGDTAGLAMLHRHVELATLAINELQGTVIKTIGDSVMAEFPEPLPAVRAAVEIQRRHFRLNQDLSEHEQVQVRIGIHAGLGFRRAHDLYGDVVNLAARITKRTGPAQITISHSVRDAIAADAEVRCNFLGKVTIEGRADKEDVYEVIWTDTAAYTELRRKATAAFARGDLVSPGVRLEDLLGGEHPAEAGGASLAALTGRYEILGEVSRGGMGIVYKARDRETADLVALKILKPEIAADQAVMERFKNELRLARKITHKNVCRIHEFNRLNGTAYISMEYVEGESLRAVLNRFGGLPVRKGIQLARQICAGLREAHSQGIVHRDLKPENIMVDRAGNVKVMDFGIALSVAMPTSQTGTIVGTPAYMAPEQAEGKKVDLRADIYALGLLLYEMFTNTPAFSGDTPVAVALKQIRESPPPPRELEPSLPPHVETAILRCLEKDPAQRFQSVDELEAALVEAEPTGAVPAAIATLAAQLKAFVRANLRQWGLVWLSAALGLGLLIAALVGGRWRSTSPPAAQAPPEATGQQAAPLQTPGQPATPAEQPPSPVVKKPAAGSAAKRETTRTTQREAAQKPAPTQQPPAAAAAGIYLVVDSFTTKEEADKLAAELEKQGFRVSVVSRSRVLWKSYQVRVGPYSSDQAALTARKRLEARGFDDVRPVQ